MGKLTKKLNKYSKEKIEIQEFLTKGDNPEEAFKEMVDSGIKCDGLVISGHHTGSFGGKRANGGLGIDFMEMLSCNEDNKEFFSNVKALWLQGCRTLGVGKIEAIESVDHHTDRVGDVLTEDHLERSFADLNMEFSATLDQDNPLSSRYLRVFPRATTFGWTKTAPGEKAKSQFSIPFHIAQMAKLNDDRKRYFQDPTKNLSKRSAIKYLKAFEKILGRDLSRGCDVERDESDAVKAWINHGNKRDVKRYAFQNSDLNAYESLIKTNNPKVLNAKKIDCLLKELNSIDTIIEVLDQLLEDEILIGYSFNSLYELIQRFSRNGNVDALVKIQKKLEGSPVLRHFLMRKLASKDIGILRRIDYYAFWRDMTGKKNKNIEQIIKKSFLKFATSETNDDYNRIDFIETLTQSMIKHRLIKDNEYKTLVDNPELVVTVLGAIAESIGKRDSPLPNTDKLFLKLLQHPRADDYVLGNIAEAIGASDFPLKNSTKILRDIIRSPLAGPYALSEVLDAISNSGDPIPNSVQIIKEVIKSPATNSAVLSSAADALVASDTSEEIITMLTELVQSPNTNSQILRSVSSAIEQAKKPVPGASKLLNDIMDSPKADSSTISGVAQALRYSDFLIPGEAQLIRRIASAKKADGHAIETIAEIIEYAEKPIEGVEKIIQIILVSKDLSLGALMSLEQAIENSDQKFDNADQFLKLIEQKRDALESELESELGPDFEPTDEEF